MCVVLTGFGLLTIQPEQPHVHDGIIDTSALIFQAFTSHSPLFGCHSVFTGTNSIQEPPPPPAQIPEYVGAIAHSVYAYCIISTQQMHVSLLHMLDCFKDNEKRIHTFSVKM